MPLYFFTPTPRSTKNVYVGGCIPDGRPKVCLNARLLTATLEVWASAEVVSAAVATPAQVGAQDLEGREDFRQLPIVTIDGETAKDFDDAVHVRRLPTGDGDLARLLDREWFTLGIDAPRCPVYVVRTPGGMAETRACAGRANSHWSFVPLPGPLDCASEVLAT